MLKCYDFKLESKFTEWMEWWIKNIELFSGQIFLPQEYLNEWLIDKTRIPMNIV